MTIYKACDIRGVVGAELNELIADRIGAALGEMIHERGGDAVCLGGDFRRSTPSLKQAVLAGLLRVGLRVIDVGQNPTPLVYFAAHHLAITNVVIVTASHNSGRYNGIKFMIAGQPALPATLAELQARVAAASHTNGVGCVESQDLRAAYQDHLLTKARQIAGTAGLPSSVRRLRIVLDAMGGACGGIAPATLEAAGYEVVALNCQPDPDFARGAPNPAVEDNLVELMQRVIAERADLGIALDGDGDRAAFVDANGVPAKPEQMGVLFIRHCFRQPKIVYDLKCASILAAAVHAADGTCTMQPSGYGFIKQAMIEQQADLGVEVSGHYFFRALHGGDDALFASLLTAHILTASSATLTEQIRSIGWPLITPDLRIPLVQPDADVLRRIAAHCAGQVNRLDGIRAEYADGWGLARLSITEPVITLRFEGRDSSSLRGIAKRFLAGVPELYRQIEEYLP